MNEWAGWLATMTGAAVLPAFVLRHAPDRLEFRIEGPISVPETAGRQESQNGMRDHINRELFRTLEKFVTQYPAQWFGWQTLHNLGLEIIGRQSDELTPASPGTMETGARRISELSAPH